MNDTVVTRGPGGKALRGRRRAAVAGVALVGALVIGSPGPSGATVSAVAGSATGMFSSVSLFGGPASSRGPAGSPGCDLTQPANASSVQSCSPTVNLPPSGSLTPITATDADGVRAVYGPAVLFGGLWWYPGGPPPSGPITVSTQGTPGPNGSVTSSVSISRAAPGATWDPSGQGKTVPWPGGIGPQPLIADGITSGCRAAETNASTGSTIATGWTAIRNGWLALTTDEAGEPNRWEPMPAGPRPNDGPHRGVISNVGDSFEVIYNEQDTSVPGAITVTAIHMRLLGPIAVGDLYIGRTRCDVRPGAGGGGTPTTTTTAVATSTDPCAQLQASLLRLNASIDAAKAAVPLSVPPESQAAMLADLEQTRAQRTAEIRQSFAATCPSPPT